MPFQVTVRPIEPGDRPAWTPLWQAYNAFYGRKNATALPDAVTESTWQRFFDPGEPVFALVAEAGGELVGLTHYVFHRSTSRIEPTCYLQDLFTAPAKRQRGVARALIEGVYAQSQSAGIHRVYWQTHATNKEGRQLYDRIAGHFGFIVYARDV